jgi:YD repeat-containing protein
MTSHQEYNPASGLYGDYELNMRNGTRLYVDPRTGDLRQLVDRTGNSLTFTSGGIFHSAGRHVRFVRDHAERITEIILPDDTPADAEDNPRIRYTYDGNGDLRAVEDRSGAVTGLFYVSPQDLGYRPHYLDRIDDPLGRTAARTEYDADGRLAKVTDADGKSIEFTYDAESKTQSMTDQLGYQTVQQLDARGNVIYDENVATGGITLREYDARDNLLWETIVIGQIDSPANGETDDLTTWYTYYPGTDDRWTVTDPRGNVSTTTYNQYGQPVSSSDAFNTTTTHYDGRGLPSAIVDGNGVRTSLGFDAKGNLEDVYNDQGVRLVHSTYNSYGDVTSTKPAAGRTTYFDYDLDGNRVGNWYFEGTDQILDVTHYDESGRVTGARRLVLPSGDHVTSGLAAVDFTAAGYTQYTLWSTGTQYNAAGQVTRSTDQFGNANETTYDLRGQTIQTRTQSGCGSEAGGGSPDPAQAAFLLSRTFYDPKGRAVVTADSFVEDPDVTAANAAAFDPEMGTYSTFTFDNTTATTGTFSVYDGAGRVVRSYRLKDITIAIVTTTAGTATVQQAELRIGANTFVPPTEAAPDEQLHETYFRELTEFFQTHGAIVSSSQTQYDNAGRVTSSFDQYGAETRTTYNRFGDVIQSATVATRSVSEGSGTELVWPLSRTVYDSLGRAEYTTDRFELPYIQDAQPGATGSPTADSPPVYTTRTIYDDQSRVVQTQRLKNVIVTITDLIENPEAQIQEPGALVSTTQTIYSTKGQVIRSIVADGQITEFEYDPFGRQIATIGHLVPADAVALPESVLSALRSSSSPPQRNRLRRRRPRRRAARQHRASRRRRGHPDRHRRQRRANHLVRLRSLRQPHDHHLHRRLVHHRPLRRLRPPDGRDAADRRPVPGRLVRCSQRVHRQRLGHRRRRPAGSDSAAGQPGHRHTDPDEGVRIRLAKPIVRRDPARGRASRPQHRFRPSALRVHVQCPGPSGRHPRQRLPDRQRHLLRPRR